MIDIDNESLKLLNVSEKNIISNSLNENFQTINSSKITNIYKNKKILTNHKKIPSLIQLEKSIHSYFKDLYYHDKHFYNIKVINDIINNFDTHLVAEFKDYLIMGDESEFLQKSYHMNECKKYLPVLLDYYKSCSIIFPNYVILHENKYIFKNIRKKQKVIDNQQEQEEKQEKIKKGEIKIEENNDFFTSKALNSILNQTNTSNVKIFFGLNNSKNKNNDSEETVNNIFKNIENAEHNASELAKKNYILKKKKLKNLMKIGIMDESQSQNNINNKLNKIKRINNNKIIKYNKSDKDKNKMNSNNINNNNKNNDINKNDKITNINTDINVLYSNINNLNKPKNIIKLNNKTRHVKSNTCIFETDTNIFLQKKTGNLIKNNSSNNKIYNTNNSNRKMLNLKEKTKTKLSNKEIIAKIMAKIKNAKSAVFQVNSSFNNLNKKRLILNITKLKNPSSISPNNKNNSNIKRNNCELIIKINESNSTPNIYNFKIIRNTKNKNNKNNKNINKNEKQFLKEEKDQNSQLQLLTVKNNLNISPLNKIILKNESYRIKSKNNIIINNPKNNNNNNNVNNFINKTIKNKIKKGEKERQKANIDIYKIAPNATAQRYITTNNNKKDCFRASNKAMTISNIKNSNCVKYNSIKVSKKTRNINSKKKKSDINNNININININSNNIFNNTNQINNSNNNNISSSINNINTNSMNNNLLNRKKYYEILRQSSSFISNRNDTQHHQILKKMLLSASNNNIFNNSKKNDIFEDISKKKHSVLNTNNTMTFSGYLTSRNSQNNSKINIKNKKDNKTTSNNKIGNMKSNISSYKVKKELFSKKEKFIYNKNKIPIVKSPKGNNMQVTKKKV